MGGKYIVAVAALGLALSTLVPSQAGDCATDVPPCRNLVFVGTQTPPASCDTPFVPGWWACYQTPYPGAEPNTVTQNIVGSGYLKTRAIGNKWQVYALPQTIVVLHLLLWT